MSYYYQSTSTSDFADVVNQDIINRKMRITSMGSDREKIYAMADLFPLYRDSLQRAANTDKVMVLFKWAFFDWADFVCRHIKCDDMEIKEREIDFFRETLTSFFQLTGVQKFNAFSFTKSYDTRQYIEQTFGNLNLIAEIEKLRDPSYREYLASLRELGPMYPKLEDLIEESYALVN